MSNLLKSKFLLGVMIVAVMFVGVFALTANTSKAADCTITSTLLKQGMKGADVTCLQTKLNVLPATGYFGTLTKAAVKAFQATNMLTADGVAGKNTLAALAGAPVVGGTYPAGCTSNVGFSTTTGASCAATTLPAGCTSTVGFSSTTGAKCDGTTGGSTVLTGGSGSIDSMNKFTSAIESIVKEGKSNNVLGLEIKANSDSDLAVKTLSLDLEHTTPTVGSYRLDRYVDTVAVYNGSTKVGSALATDFSRTSQISSKTLNLSDVVVKAGQKVRLTVVFEAKSSIQSSSTNATNDIGAGWNVKATEVRYQDASGLTMTKSSTLNANVTFQSATLTDTASLQSSSANPNDTNIQVKANTLSDDYLVGAFKIKAGTDSSDLNVTSIPVKLTIYNPAGGSVTPDAGDVVNSIYLKVGDMTYDNYTASGTALAIANSTSEVETYTFDIDSGDLNIPSNSSKEVKVFVKFGSQSTKYDAGTTVVPSVAASAIVVENKAGDGVTSPSSPFTGSTMTLLVNGASVTYVSGAFTPVDVSGSPTVDGTIKLTFRVANFGDTDVTIAETQVNGATAAAGVVVNDVTGGTEVGNGIITSSEVTKNSSNNFVVSAGDTTGKVFTLSRKFNTTSGFVKLAITSVDQTAVSNVQTDAY